MKFLLVAFCLFFFSTSYAAKTSTKVLALRLWNAIEKQQNLSYAALDNLRTKLPETSEDRKKLMDPKEFKRYQLILRNMYIDKISRAFTRQEIINLGKIYNRPEMSKLRLFSMDFWDQKDLLEVIQNNPPQTAL